MHPPRQRGLAPSQRQRGFTLIEALIAIVILMVFAVTSTMALNFFDDRAARNRNTEAARAVVDDYVNYLLSDSLAAPAVTGPGTDIDGDGIADGVPCTSILGRTVPAAIPLIVTRTASPTPIVTGVLYWRVQNVGTAYGCAADTDLVQVNFLLQYTYRSQTFYYKVITFKANT